ncbi:MAG: branched-chain amino acid ABC transporter permease [Armatimonadota bacterium]|nr:branched-chain amino acid ABC transporter permease [Armatimonadota bacterium]
MRKGSPDTWAFAGAVGVVLLLGWLELRRPGGVSIARISGGLLTIDLLIRAGIFTIILVGLNLLMGYAGQVSLGQAAFYGMGAYFSAILTVKAAVLGISPAVARAWWWPWFVMGGAAVLVGVFSFLIGWVILRLRGHYLAMATLGLGIMVYIVLRENLGIPQLNLTGGFDGIVDIPRLHLGAFALWPESRYYFLVWAVALATIVLGLNVVHSPVGRALRAIHGSEAAAESVGIVVPLLKAQIFALSASLASLAGSLYAHFQAAVVPDTFGFVPSLELVVMSAIGGMASIWGAPLGVLAVLLIQELLRTHVLGLIPAVTAEMEPVIFGALLVLIMMFWPGGLVSSRRRRPVWGER